MIPHFTLYAIKKYKNFSTDIIIGSLHLQRRYHPDTTTKTVLELHFFLHVDKLLLIIMSEEHHIDSEL